MDFRRFETPSSNFGTVSVCFYNSARDTRNGFAHDTEMSIYSDNNFMGEMTGSAHYLNRTWEKYTYQSVMINTLKAYMNTVREADKQAYREKNGISRISSKRLSDFERYHREDGFIETLENIITIMKNAH